MNLENALAETERANARLIYRFKVLLCMQMVAYFACLLLPGTFELVAIEVARYIPSIQKLLSSGDDVGQFAARYFSICWLASPIMLVYLLWGEKPVARITVGSSRLGRGPIAVSFFSYFIVLPVVALFIYLLYEGDLYMHEGKPRLFGQHVFFLMRHTYVGLLVLGTGLALGMVFTVNIIAALLVYPIALLFHNWREVRRQE